MLILPWIFRNGVYSKQMKNYLLLVLCCCHLFLFSCQEKKVISLSGDQPVSAPEFITFFETLKQPYTLADTLLQKKLSDSLRISYAVLTALVPDSVWKKEVSKSTRPVFHAIGKIEVPKAETYLLVRTQTKTKKFVLLLVFNKQYEFVTALSALEPSASKAILQSLVIDRKLLISILQQRKNKDGSLSEGKEVFVFNEAARNFMLIMTEALEDKVEELINPIDTLTATHRFAEDYGSGKMNLVSIRDGRKKDRITFFVHFEKKNGSCVGELKGEAFWKSSTKAEYRQAGDPCVLQFQFSKQGVTLKESNCGSRRGTDCLFDGSFARKKPLRVKKKQ
jgi:hypothetical protein